MNIIIDPYFLDLEDEDEIRSNISYFQDLVFLCNTGRVKIHLYKDMVQKMLERDVKPFPIGIWKISDDLRVVVNNLNKAFTNVVMQNIQPLDIEECGGEQRFVVSSDIEEVENQLQTDSRYDELLSVLLQTCYNENLEISNSIITGDIKRGRKIGDTFTLNCRCNKFYGADYRFATIREFETDQDRAYLNLRELNNKNIMCFNKSPIIVRGDHHNKLQFNSDFTTYEGLSRANKSVISVLRKFGLCKIIFGEFHEKASRAKGTILAYDITLTNEFDIIKGWLFAETGYKNHVALYFPKGVGEGLRKYLNDDFNKNAVERLADSLTL